MHRLLRPLPVVLLGAASALAAAADWKVFDLGRPDPRAAVIDIAAINHRGEVTGGVMMFGPAGLERFAFVASNGAFERFGQGVNAVPTIVKDINRSGLVVGTDTSAFVYDGARSPLAGVAGFSVANAINDHGVIVGHAVQPADGGFRAFRYEDGRLTDVGTLGGPGSHAYGINRRGDIVGTADTPRTRDRLDFGHAYLLPRGGAMIDLGTLGGLGSVAYAINNRGDIVGASLMPGNAAKHGFLYRDGTMIDLGTLPGAQNSDAIGINDRGDIVGISVGSSPAGFSERPFLWRDGTMIDLAALPELAEAGFTSWVIRGHQVAASDSEGPGIAINNHGDIAGIGIKNGEERIFVISPAGSRR